MQPKYDPASLEQYVTMRWEAADAFAGDMSPNSEKPAFTIVIPPPNVTGSLHIGHALNNTLQDILCRFERMRGKRVLWQPGMDHAGIATQMVVERQLAARGEPDRRSMGREAFLEKVWDWKAESGGVIMDQLKRLGASCDWSRARFTMDDGLSAGVIKIFVQLYRDGLIYKDQRLVNWDPKLHTAISDLEVQQIEVKGHLWYFNYPLVDANNKDTGEFITIATTRPETMLGDTGIAVHPENEALKHFIGRHARLPLVGRIIPIVGDEYADPEKGTGAVKITPAHDFNDFEVGRRHGLAEINVLDTEGRIDLGGYDIEGLHGKDRFVARKEIVAMMEAQGLLVDIQPHTHPVPHGDRSGVVIEPRLTEQWYVDAATLSAPALKAVEEGKTQFVPTNWTKTYFEWLNNIQPWCISRQLWWGHQIPAWYGMRREGDEATGPKIFVAETLEEAMADAREYYGTDAFAPLEQDPDVLDTWFSSALWPFATLGWPEQTPDQIKATGRYPTDVLVTGFDIIFFWVARMMMMGIYIMKDVPFRDVYIHALVRDATGAKMSKSKGNVVNPLELMDQYGVDALRFTLTAMAAQGRDIKLAIPRVEGYRNFATKIWNAARFAQMNQCELPDQIAPPMLTAPFNRWIVSEASKAVQEVTQALEAYRFNDAANKAYRFVWNLFCDWYVELSKPALLEEGTTLQQETRATLSFVFDVILKLLHPIMPFITEGLWEARGHKDLLTLATWPDLSTFQDEAATRDMNWIIELVTEVRALRNDMKIPESASLPLRIVSQDASLQARLKAVQPYMARLTKIESLEFVDQAPPHSAQLLIDNVLVALPMEGIVDLEAERARLGKEIAKLEAELSKLEGRLNNANFVAQADPDAVEDARARLIEGHEQREKLNAALEHLK